MSKLGFIVPDLGPSQLSFGLIKAANDAVAVNPGLCVTVFYENIRLPCVCPHFACMHVAEAYLFDGSLIATSFSAAEKMARMPSSPRKLFYVWDLDWLRPWRRQSFNEHALVYGNESIELLARSGDHAKVIAQAWNRSVAVTPDFVGLLENLR
jgi:hypothetical protein